MRHRALLFISATAAVVGTVAVIGLTAWWRDNGTSLTSQNRHPSDIPLHMGMTYLPSVSTPVGDTAPSTGYSGYQGH